MLLEEVRSISDVEKNFDNEELIIRELIRLEILHNGSICSNCGKNMEIRRKRGVLEWRCRLSKNKDCSSRSIRYNSFFSFGRVNFVDFFKLMVMWSNGMSSKNIQRELKLSSRTVCDYRNYLREICQKIEAAYPPLGGVNHTIEIDETCLHARKYGKGSSRGRTPTWVIGGFDRVTRRVFAKKVPTRTAKCLCPILQHHIDPDSDIYSDGWKAYVKIDRIFHSHSVVNHNAGFTAQNPNGVLIHTNNIESYWNRFKQPLKKSNGTSEDLLDSYVSESVVRENEQGDFFKNVLLGMRNYLT